jgi:cytochrome c oxidase subunit 3
MQYADLPQQGDTAQLGMWVFITTETLFFGALLFTYFLYRMTYPHEFAAAAKDAVLWCGSVNIGLIMTSSLTMVLAINSAADGRRRALVYWLVATAFLGLCFLGVKGYEYCLDYNDNVVPAVNFVIKPGEGPAGELFWVFYFVATGLHAIHMTIGIGLILYMLLWRVRRGEITPAYYAPLEVVGLYWSFVDTVWIFLFPSIYLVGRS